MLLTRNARHTTQLLEKRGGIRVELAAPEGLILLPGLFVRYCFLDVQQ